jgi:hypothetical protein
MNYKPAVRNVQELIEDYVRDFGVTFEDAERITLVVRRTSVISSRSTAETRDVEYLLTPRSAIPSQPAYSVCSR